MKAGLLLLLLPTLSLRADLTPALALQHLEAGKFADAIAELKSLNTAPEPCQVCPFYLGVAYYRSGDLGQARAAFKEELKKEAPMESKRLALGYAFLILAKQPEEAWFKECLAQAKSDAAPSGENSLFLAQGLLDAASLDAYPKPLRLEASQEVIRAAKGVISASSSTPGARNALGRALILSGEMQGFKAGSPADMEHLKAAEQAFADDLALAASAPVAQNLAITKRLLAEGAERNFWGLKKKARSVPEAVSWATLAKGYFEASGILLGQAQDYPKFEKYKLRIEAMQRLTAMRSREFLDNASVKKVLDQ